MRWVLKRFRLWASTAQRNGPSKRFTRAQEVKAFGIKVTLIEPDSGGHHEDHCFCFGLTDDVICPAPALTKMQQFVGRLLNQHRKFFGAAQAR